MSRIGLRLGAAALLVLSRPPATPIDLQAQAGPTMARANSYDDGWEGAWVNHARTLAGASGKTDGFVLQIGDSITHSRAYSAWAVAGQGHTADDAALLAWMGADTWSSTENDTESKNGFYLAGADTTALRGLTSASGLSTAELRAGCCNPPGPAMPSETVPAAARTVLANTTYSSNLHVDTLTAAFADAQFAVLMLGTNEPSAPANLADLTFIVSRLEAANILPILSTIPPRSDGQSNQLTLEFNAGVRALAMSHSLPLIDYYEEILLRRPGATWMNTLISADGVHPTGDRAGFTVTSSPYANGGNPATHTTGGALANVGYLLRGWLTVQKLKEVKRYVIDGVDPGLNIVHNGGFGGGMSNWQTFATPDQGYITFSVNNGVLEFLRTAPPVGTTNQAVVFQNTGAAVAAGVPVLASFSLGNSSAVRKRVSVLLHDADFSDLAVCTFWLPASAPLRTYAFSTRTTRAWVDATISIYAATAGSDGGSYRLDNVAVQPHAVAPTGDTSCLDPTAPAAAAGVDGPDLLANGSFGSGTLTPWSVFGAIAWQLTGGVFEFHKPPGTPAGVVLQTTPHAIPSRTIIRATFELGNSSSVRKRVTVLVHDGDFSDLSACTFWLPPGQALTGYAVQTFTTTAWIHATVSVYPSTLGGESWIRLDNVTLRQTPSAPTSGTACLATGEADQLDEARAPPRRSSRVSPSSGTVATNPAWTPDGFLTVDPADARPDEGRWLAVAPESGTSTLTLDSPVDASRPRLVRTFRSRLRSTHSRAEVQLSFDGIVWFTAQAVPSSDDWRDVELDLSPHSGHVVFVRFAFERLTPAGGALDVWEIDLRGW